VARREITVKHPDGRAVHALVLGEPKCGRVVVYHHGFPACRLEALLARKHALELQVCIVAIDRPGMGNSDWYPDRRLEEWPGDVRLVLDELGVAEFAILGVSGGTPSAVATAVAMPDRVRTLTVVSGMAPMNLPGAQQGTNTVNRFMMGLIQRYPTVGRTTIGGIASVWRAVPTIAALWMVLVLPKQDRALITESTVAATLGRSTADALQAGVRGVVTDFGLLASHWGELLTQVSVPTTIWHGTGDTYVPFAMGRILHERIAGSELRVVPDGGHFMMVELLGDILLDLSVRSWRERDAGAA
jgi:pimeloyl-ACP methyl ester carboxylesterase